ncbi:terminase TerL endonuclease subunit [Lactococcus nasutitermitis]|uniref:Terminase TerL endonuclease subunit n=1 Tax=Lactococcus nasutitermitis TaxID=1652957 RepID=A0ABV9JF19_9LACT|nr:terminase TerL endonuclease subunit [Lactococcus nasutitermitis]
MIAHVKDYIESYAAGKISFNQERIELVNYIKREVEPRVASGEIYFDMKQIESCIGYIEKWFFALDDFQKFIISFVFLYFKENKRNVYRKILIMIARGNGKNGLLSGIGSYLTTPMHGISKYNISIVANSEDQAKTSFDEIYDTIESHEELEKLFGKPRKSEIKNIQTKSLFKFRTSNGNTKDGLRDGAVIFDEIHQYESNKDVKVHISGLGKRPNPREFYIGTDGYVRDGFIDQMKELAKRVLKGEAKWNALFPFICKLDDVSQVDDKTKWELANPMFSAPMTEYAQGLFETVSEDYEDLEDNPSGRDEFMTKRMNYPVTDTERSVATHEELVATKRDFPDLHGRIATGGFDFASIRDFIAVGALFKIDGNYIFKSHSFVRKGFVDAFYGYSKPKEAINGKRQFAPIKKWEKEGLLTVLDEPSMNPQHVVDWFVRMRDEEGYDFQTICGDNFRMDIIKPLFEAEGFEVSWNDKFEAPLGYRVEVIRNFRAIDALLAPRIEDAFANQKVIFGNNDMMRWYTQNVLRRLKSDGNVEYVKKEETRRKTDGFKAFEAAMYKADELNNEELTDFYDNNAWFYE